MSTKRIPWNKGLPWSEEAKKKNSDSQKGEKGNKWGKKNSEETRKKISRSNKGRAGGMEGKRHSEETRIKMSLARKGRIMTEETKQKIREKRALQVFTPETRNKMAEAHRGDKNPMNNPLHRLKVSGKNCHFWKGGITPENIRIRTSLEYKKWRKDVFERDNYTCQICGQVGGTLQADHIKSFAANPESRFDLNNGRTLCLSCHKKTDNYLKYRGGKI